MDAHQYKILSAEFLTTAVEPDGYPKPAGPEIAFVGRSNVGKSSMINALCNRHKLVRVSNDPGRTRTLNFFSIALEEKRGARREVRFCDLPGYGFAKVSKGERRQWQKMIETYIETRASLSAVVAIIDACVGPTEDDLDVVPWLTNAGRKVIVVGTKIDRIPKHLRIPSLKAIEQKLSVASSAGRACGQVLGFSSTKGLGLGSLWKTILDATS